MGLQRGPSVHVLSPGSSCKANPNQEPHAIMCKCWSDFWQKNACFGFNFPFSTSPLQSDSHNHQLQIRRSFHWTKKKYKYPTVCTSSNQNLIIPNLPIPSHSFIITQCVWTDYARLDNNHLDQSHHPKLLIISLNPKEKKKKIAKTSSTQLCELAPIKTLESVTPN